LLPWTRTSILLPPTERTDQISHSASGPGAHAARGRVPFGDGFAYLERARRPEISAVHQSRRCFAGPVIAVQGCLSYPYERITRCNLRRVEDVRTQTSGRSGEAQDGASSASKPGRLSRRTGSGAWLDSGSGHLVQEAVHAANLAVLVDDRDVEPDHDRFATVRGSEMPSEASLVMVRVGRPGRAGASSRGAAARRR